MTENYSEVPVANESDLLMEGMAELESGERKITFELITKGILEDTGKVFSAEMLECGDSEAQAEMKGWLERHSGVAKSLKIFTLSTAFVAAGTSSQEETSDK